MGNESMANSVVPHKRNEFSLVVGKTCVCGFIRGGESCGKTDEDGWRRTTLHADRRSRGGEALLGKVFFLPSPSPPFFSETRRCLN